LEKLIRKLLHSLSLATESSSARGVNFGAASAAAFLKATVFAVAFSFAFGVPAVAAPALKKKLATKSEVSTSPTPGAAGDKTGDKAGDKSEETYQDLIQKAQNLTLQQDRLQTSQVLIRGIQRENRGSTAYRELVRVLDELTAVFYTEKTQNLFANAESVADKPREAIEAYQEALKTDDRNVSILKALARLHLRLDECEKADGRVKQAEEVNPYSAEVRLLRLQTLDCQKNFDMLSTRLGAHDADLEPVEKYTRGMQMLDLLRHKELKKAKALLVTWETQSPDYPEVFFWKWQLSKEGTIDKTTIDRSAAAKYSQLCQNLTARKRKSFSLDVDLCKGKEAADVFLKEKEALGTTSAAEETK
jgi:tetratricopeptide (TPR) repeat protein